MPDMALNAEALPQHLDSDITPIDDFFVRNNGTLPAIDGDRLASWRVEIGGEVNRAASFSLSDLRKVFPVTSVTAVLECAGNGRAFFDPATDGLQWRHGAVGCALWTGVRLRDLLQFVGVSDTAVYTGHYSPDLKVGGTSPALSRGLPIAKALAEETLLAFEMNGKPLPVLHGGPLRVVAPGFPGSAWQKWLTKILVRDQEHDGEKMSGLDYRMPTVPVSPGGAFNPADFQVITDIPVKSLITHPVAGFIAPNQSQIEIRGVAWSGHDLLESAAVSINSGKSWMQVDLDAPSDRFAWRRFRAVALLEERGPVEVMVRATSLSGCSQPLDNAPWNPRGYSNNRVHRVAGTVV